MGFHRKVGGSTLILQIFTRIPMNLFRTIFTVRFDVSDTTEKTCSGKVRLI